MPWINFSSLDRVEDLIVAFLASKFFLAPVLLLFIDESGIPLPTSDFVIAYTGYEVAQGKITFLSAFLTLLIADLAGASILYYLCRTYGPMLVTRVGKFIDLDEKKLTTVQTYFRKYGVLVIIFGRHIPGFRIPITVFAGITKISYPTFIISTFVSVLFWIAFYLTLGQHLGPKTVKLVHTHIWYGALILLPIVLSFVPFYFLRKTHKRKK